MSKKKIRLYFTVDYGEVMTRGFSDATDGLRLREDGKVIVPLYLQGGYRMFNPAPCGTWEVIEDE